MDTLPLRTQKGKPNLVPPTSGIYKITCTSTEKFYIGSAVNLQTRRYDHFKTLQENKHKNPKLQRAWNKYGEDAFTFEVLELVLVPFLLEREQYWFDKLKPFDKKGFNIARVAGSNLGGTHTPETREKIRQAKLGKKMPREAVEKSRQANLGRKLTPEQLEERRSRKHKPESIEKMRSWERTPEYLEKLRVTRNTPEARERNRQSQLGKKLSPETKEKLRQANLGKKMSPEAIEKTRQASLGRNVGRKHTPEEIEKMKQAHAARKAKKREMLSQKPFEDM